jgi:hypothetical protein
MTTPGKLARKLQADSRRCTCHYSPSLCYTVILFSFIWPRGPPQQVSEDQNVDDKHRRHVQNRQIVRDAEVGGVDVALPRTAASSTCTTEVEILLKAGYPKTEVARLSGVFAALGKMHRGRESIVSLQHPQHPPPSAPGTAGAVRSQKTIRRRLPPRQEMESWPEA